MHRLPSDPDSRVARVPGRRPPPPDYHLYLYCVVEAGTGAASILSDRAVPGVDPAEPLFPIEVEGLVAAVSRVPAETFAEEALNTLVTDLSRLAPYAVRHEEAIRALLPAAPALVPMAFGAVYQGPAGVRALLEARGAALRALLARLRDKEEWGLKVFLDADRLRASAAELSPALRALEEQAASSPPGRAYLLGRRREQLLTAEAERLAAEALTAILERLAGVAVEVRQDRLPAREPGGLHLALKAAFLVVSGRAAEIAGLVNELDRSYRPMGLALEWSGPWAPYSFVGGTDDAA